MNMKDVDKAIEELEKRHAITTMIAKRLLFLAGMEAAAGECDDWTDHSHLDALVSSLETEAIRNGKVKP